MSQQKHQNRPEGRQEVGQDINNMVRGRIMVIKNRKEKSKKAKEIQIWDSAAVKSV